MVNLLTKEGQSTSPDTRSEFQTNSQSESSSKMEPGLTAHDSSKEVRSEMNVDQESLPSNRQFAVSQPVLKSNPENSERDPSQLAKLYKQSTTLDENLKRSKSASRKANKSQNEIQKDVDRTFQGDKYFKREDVKRMLFTVLHQYTQKSNLKYVQGMNFIAGFVVHHSMDYELCFNIFMFIQGSFSGESP